jgi:hypothetical protein
MEKPYVLCELSCMVPLSVIENLVTVAGTFRVSGIVMVLSTLTVPTISGKSGPARVTLPVPPRVRKVSLLTSAFSASEFPVFVNCRFKLRILF